MDDINITIIGAGVVGLAIAERLSRDYENVAVIEKYESFGMETSSRSSEVIHASVYYPQNTLKGTLCLRGNELMYQICQSNNIPHANTGKLIVACDAEEVKRLPKVLESALANGAKGARIVGKDEIATIEPNVFAEGAVYFPSSGIVDSHQLMAYFEKAAIKNGAMIAYKSEVVGVCKNDSGYSIKVKDNTGDEYEFNTRYVINCAGLFSDKVAAMLGIDVDAAGYKINYHKGIYFRANRNLDLYPKALIYPLPPEAGSVGVHTTPDLYGGMRLGPHFIWSDNLDYSVNDEFKEFFYESAKKYLPFLEIDDITPDMSGFMSAIQSPDSPEWKDFIIRDESDKGLPGFINLIGMESPALTASPAIAEYVAELLKKVSL